VSPRPSLAYRFTAAASRPLLRLLYRYQARGLADLPPSGGFVLAAGHHSNFDPWPLALALAPRRYVRFMAKTELFWPPLSLALRAVGAFPVRRGEPDRAALSTARRLAREGNVIAMFPEGTRRRKGAHKTRQADAHSGAARIALAAGVPLVPAALSGTDRLSRLAPLRVAYGAPIPLDDLARLGRREAARIATERLMTRIAELETSLSSF
jgi:1-acyl-sn-glycerol-3-phosphate acyltransferase